MDGKEVKTVCENKVKQDLWFSVAHIIQWYVYSKMPLHFSYFFLLLPVLSFTFLISYFSPKLTLAFCLCISPLLHCPVLPVHTQAPRIGNRNIHRNTLIHSTLPSFLGWSFFFLWVGLECTVDMLERKNANCGSAYRMYFHSWEENITNMESW